MPSLATITDWWWEHAVVTKTEELPSTAFLIDSGEPNCFACEWRVPPQFSGNDAWSDRRLSGFLDRAHLQDHALGGSSEPSNLVPMCGSCHRIMNGFEFRDRAEALLWVKTTPPIDPIYQMATDEWWNIDMGGVSAADHDHVKSLADRLMRQHALANGAPYGVD